MGRGKTEPEGADHRSDDRQQGYRAQDPRQDGDVVVDFGSVPVGTAVDLVNRLGTGPAGQVMRFVVTRPARDESRVPDRLVEVAPLVPSAGAVTREFWFTRGLSDDHGGWRINGQSFDPAGSLADVPLGDRRAVAVRHRSAPSGARAP